MENPENDNSQELAEILSKQASGTFVTDNRLGTVMWHHVQQVAEESCVRNNVLQSRWNLKGRKLATSALTQTHSILSLWSKQLQRETA